MFCNGQQTPFAEFAFAVQQLCKKFWPLSFEEVRIEHLGSGSSNRVIGLSISSALDTFPSDPFQPPTNHDRYNHYVLRIPWWDDFDIVKSIVNLYYVSSRTTVPVPQVVAFDLEKENPIEKPYTLQRRVPGVCLQNIFYDFTEAQRRDLAVALAKIIEQLQGLVSPVAGEIGFPPQSVEKTAGLDLHEEKQHLKDRLALIVPTNTSSHPPKHDLLEYGAEETNSDDPIGLKVLHFNKSNLVYGDRDPYNGTVNKLKHNFGSDVLGCYHFQFGRNLMIGLDHCNGDILRSSYFSRLMQVTKEMDDLACFWDSTNVLYHGDLEARNIMVSIDDAGSLKITGILDWDDAKFVPRCVSCYAPRWLWCYKPHVVPDDECKGHGELDDPDDIEVKQLFDEHVGTTFVRHAYPRKYCLARRLFYFALEGLDRDWEYEWVDDLVEEWSELRKELEKNGANSVDERSFQPHTHSVCAKALERMRSLRGKMKALVLNICS